VFAVSGEIKSRIPKLKIHKPMNLPVFFSAEFHISLRDEQKLRVLENKLLREMPR
jgi:hypothetical protein